MESNRNSGYDSGQKIKIGLIEDNEILRNSYTFFFDSEQLFKTVFAVDDVHDLPQVSLLFQPDVILLEILLPSGNSLTRLCKIRKLFPVARIVILTSVVDELMTQKAVSNGVDGFLLKTSSLQFIKDSITQLLLGGFPVSPVAATHLLNPGLKMTMAERFPSLTKREFELISLLVTGISNQLAADRLNITYFTVNSHLKNIYTKISINSKSELIAMMVKFQPLN